MSLFKKTVVASHMTIEERRKLLDSSAGRIFHVTFVKKTTGEVREMRCKKFVESFLTYGKSNVKDNPCKHIPEIYTVSDVGEADAFRNLYLTHLKKVVLNNTEYVF